jgi:hypothetical protein
MLRPCCPIHVDAGLFNILREQKVFCKYKKVWEFYLKTVHSIWAWWLYACELELRRLSQRESEFEINMGYLARFGLKR